MYEIRQLWRLTSIFTCTTGFTQAAGRDPEKAFVKTRKPVGESTSHAHFSNAQRGVEQKIIRAMQSDFTIKRIWGFPQIRFEFAL